jgi:hypothetical protein
MNFIGTRKFYRKTEKIGRVNFSGKTNPHQKKPVNTGFLRHEKTRRVIRSGAV